MAAYRMTLDMNQLLILVARARFPLSNPAAVRHMGQAVRQYGAMVQQRAVFNVSGYPVVYQGGVFRVQVKTGALKGAIELEWPYGSVFTCRVYVNGAHTGTFSAPGFYEKPKPVSDYAGAIEEGHDEIDLKKTMMGKTVPFFGSTAKTARGPYAADGLKPVTAGVKGFGAQFQSDRLNAKLAALGKNPMRFEKRGGKAAFEAARGGAGTYFIAFRKVGKTGWVIPRAAPRPFMGAAVEGTKEKGRLLMVRAGVEMLNPKLP